ncbi:MAG: hypothetical protein R3E94_11005 [Burkholderiaceae bacterium]
MNALTEVLGRLLHGVFRIVLALAGLVFLVSLMLAGLIAVVLLSLWSLLTGRKPAPAMVFQRFQQRAQSHAQGAWTSRGPAAQRPSRGDVVDVQAQEVPDPSNER